MTREWRVIFDGPGTGLRNMLTDTVIFSEVCAKKSPQTVRFYEWLCPTITYGYSQDYPEITAAEWAGAEKVRRPTGGGIVFHGSDLTFSIIADMSAADIPYNYLQSYKFLNTIIMEALRLFYQETGLDPLRIFLWEQSVRPAKTCFSAPTLYDIVVDGTKIMGAAQRRRKKTILYQSSLNFETLMRGEDFPSEKRSCKKQVRDFILLKVVQHLNCRFSKSAVTARESAIIEGQGHI